MQTSGRMQEGDSIRRGDSPKLMLVSQHLRLGAHLRHDPAVVAQEVQRAAAFDVQVDVDAAVLVQEEQPHRVRPLHDRVETIEQERLCSCMPLLPNTY